MLNIQVLGGEHAKQDPGVDSHHQGLAVDQGKRIILIKSNIVELGLESVQLRNKVLLIFYLTTLAFRMVSIDKGYGPSEWDPPLVFP